MECPHCKAELKYDTYTYKGNLAAYEKGYEGSGFKKTGEIWYCPNKEGFENLEDAENYKKEINSDLPVEEIVCDSSTFNGYYWTDLQGNIHEGYPS